MHELVPRANQKSGSAATTAKTEKFVFNGRLGSSALSDELWAMIVSGCLGFIMDFSSSDIVGEMVRLVRCYYDIMAIR